MQLFPLLLVVIVLAADGGVQLLGEQALRLSDSLLIATVPVMVVFGSGWLTIILSERRLSRGASLRPLMLADRAVRYGRSLLLLNHAIAVLEFGWLESVRAVTGDVVLLDELLAIAPPLLGAVGLWWAYYPIERRIRESLLVRRLDLGKPVYPMPNRVQYVMLQVRTGLLFLLVPIVLILGIGETIQIVANAWGGAPTAEFIANGATLIAAAVVFAFAPLMMRLLLHVEPLPNGEIRGDLLAICQRHQVRVRDLLLWKTGGSMINAAVMGLVGRLRYVLITDALIETMSEDQLKAVMAHEVGHVRRHHMPWLVVCFAAALFAAMWLVELPLMAMHASGLLELQQIGQWMSISLIVAQLALGLIVFGWVCRRFERQADTFAVQHLSRAAQVQTDDSTGHVPVSGDAVHAMCGALETIAQLNAVDRQRPSWRHGSIAWRQDYLISLVGRPLDALPIDSFIRIVKWVAAIVLAMTVGAWLLF